MFVTVVDRGDFRDEAGFDLFDFRGIFFAGETLLCGKFGFRDFGFADLLDFGEFLLDFIGNPVQDSAAPFESKFVCAFPFDFSIK